nr:hypothetical protein [Bacillus mediterraneensis]
MDHSGLSKIYNIRRLRCTNCRNIHHDQDQSGKHPPGFHVRKFRDCTSKCFPFILDNDSVRSRTINTVKHRTYRDVINTREMIKAISKM